MSLEQALQQNTEALNRLAETIKAAGISTCGTGGITPAGKPATTRAATTPAAKVEAAAVSPSELKYVDIQKPFLQLVNANRDKAVALLAELGISSLKAIEDKPEMFADVLAKIEAAHG